MRFKMTERKENPEVPHEEDVFQVKLEREGDIPEKEKSREEEEEVLRWTLSQRIQHVILFTCFGLLIFTGLPILLPNWPFVRKLFFFQGSFLLRGVVHRTAAIGLILLSIYHIGYSLLSERGNRDLKEMLPRKKDLTDFWGTFLFNIGRRKKKPLYDRFGFIEKFEYWAVVWGTYVMIVTGFLLWFEEAALALFPKWVFDIVITIHGFEAILAFLAVIIWHFYNVHFNPEVFPMSRIWITGKISKKKLMERHPIEYQKMMEEKRKAEALKAIEEKIEEERRINDK
jgi:cytochrome b subunit of formate dehydrogenase